MCGICGLIGRDFSDSDARLQIHGMRRALVHRGPDDHGCYLSPAPHGHVRAALGHQRLSIIDLESGHQPMASEDKKVWLTYNGEIYNHQDLRQELEGRGYVYKTHSDTETVLHAYEEYGAECVKKFRGMFAFAVWDGRTRRLFAARDRLGIKPFYYALHNGTLIFASEIKSILASGLFQASVNYQALPEFFAFGQTVDDATLFQGIRKLMPGHWLSYDGNDIKTHKYWDWQFDEPSKYLDDNFYIERFGELLEDAVRTHLMSDVPVGLFLSGGLDSSLIAAIMAKLHPQQVDTFTVGFEDHYYSEFDHARTVATHVGTRHHEALITAKEFFDVIPKLIEHEDEPLKGAASVALYFISKLASEHVKVVLTGEGSDELFAGYNDRYWVTLLNRRLVRFGGIFIPTALRKQVVRKLLWQLPLPLALKKKISHTIVYLSPNLDGIFFDNFHAIFTAEMQAELFCGEPHRGFSGVDPYANANALFERSNAQNFLHQLLYTDVNMDLVELLMKQDQMSMAASIESRVPFLDHLLVEFAGTIPPHLRLKGRAGKRLVKKVAENYLPYEIVHRSKMGFPVPFDNWLKDDSAGMIDAVLLDDKTKNRGYFNLPYIEKLLKSHRRGQRDYQNQIWMLLNFELWHRVFLDSPVSRPSL
jgi:asparagine synthase (glutamine-hydrolysing)